jgi:hypothetical protein
MPSYLLQGHHSISFDRVRRWLRYMIVIHCTLTVNHLMLQSAVEKILTGKLCTRGLRGVRIIDVTWREGLGGACVWQFTVVAEVRRREFKSTTWFGRILPTSHLTYSPQRILRRVECALQLAARITGAPLWPHEQRSCLLLQA